MDFKNYFRLIACGALLLTAGCNSDRLDRLEKENQELQAQISREIKDRAATTDYDLQAKCSKDARVWFNENWSRDKDTLLLDFTNHYNKKLNKCFILVEYHYHSTFERRGDDAWTNDMTLMDVYENSKYANFAESHTTRWKPAYSLTHEVIVCEMLAQKCKTIDEFNGLIRTYLND